MSRPTDWSPLHLDSDPIPGDPHVVKAFATRYSNVAEAIRTAATKLNSIADHSDGEQSEYVDKFRDEAREVANKVSRAHQRYARVASAMHDYATPLEQAQSDADAALIRARNASDAHSTATTLDHHYEQELQRPDLTDDDRTRYTQLQQQNQSHIADNQREIGLAQGDLQRAIDHRNSAANAAADSIDEIEGSGKLKDSGWSKFWEQNGGWIGEVVDVIGKVAAVLALVAILIPGLGEVILAIIAIVAIVSMVLTVVNAICQMSAGTKSVGAGIFEIAMAVIPFGAGKILGAVGKTAGTSVEEAAAVTLRSSKAAQGIRGWTQSRALTEVKGLVADVKPTLLQRWLSTDAKGLAQLQALGKADLTVGGASARIAGLADKSLWKFMDMPGIEPIANLTGAEHVVGEKLDELNDSRELAAK